MKLSRLLRRDPDAPSLRARLDASRARAADLRHRAGLALRVGRVAFQPPEPEPVDRIALINYASWLFAERRLVCRELYPHLGAEAAAFVRTGVAADAFHFPTGPRTGQDVPPPSSRAVAMLDRLGIDWRADCAARGDLDPPAREEDERPRPPHGWPAPDGALLTALSDLHRLDAVLAAVLAGLPAERDPETVPGAEAVQEARDAVLGTLTRTRADGLPGLQAKARALLTDGVREDPGTAEALARSLAWDLVGRRHGQIAPKPDPIVAAIEACRRLDAAHAAALAVSSTLPDEDPAHEHEQEAYRALWGHWDSVVLRTVPTTARGCAALARYTVEFLTAQGLEEHRDEILTLIARSPLL